eukprot:SAG31_NODE_25_length_33055_cov_11.407919_8_plen_1435_part_00
MIHDQIGAVCMERPPDAAGGDAGAQAAGWAHDVVVDVSADVAATRARLFDIEQQHATKVNAERARQLEDRRQDQRREKQRMMARLAAMDRDNAMKLAQSERAHRENEQAQRRRAELEEERAMAKVEAIEQQCQRQITINTSTLRELEVEKLEREAVTLELARWNELAQIFDRAEVDRVEERAAADAERERLENATKKLIAEFTQMKIEHDEQLQQLRRTVVGKNAAIETISHDVTALRAQLEGAESALQEVAAAKNTSNAALQKEIQELQATLCERDVLLQQMKDRESRHADSEAACKVQLQQVESGNQELLAELTGWRAAAEQAAAHTSEIYEEMHRRVAIARLEGREEGRILAVDMAHEFEAAAIATQIASAAASCAVVRKREIDVAACVTASAVDAVRRVIVMPLRQHHEFIFATSPTAQEKNMQKLILARNSRSITQVASEVLIEHMTTVGDQLQRELSQRSNQTTAAATAAADRADSLAKELADAYEQLPAVRESAAKQYSELLRAHESLRRSQLEVEAQLSETEVAAKARQSDVATLQKTNEQLSSTIQQLRSELEHAEQSAAEIAEDRSNTKMILKNVEAELVNAREQNWKLHSEAREDIIQELRRQQQEITTPIQQANTELNQIRQDLLRKDTIMAELTAQLQQAEQAGLSERDRSNAIENASKAAEARMTAELQLQAQQLSDAAVEVQRWQQNATQMDAQVSDLSKQGKKLSDEKTKLVIECDELQHCMDECKVQHSKQLAELRQDLTGLQDEHQMHLTAAKESEHAAKEAIRQEMQRSLQENAENHRLAVFSMEQLHREALVVQEENHRKAQLDFQGEYHEAEIALKGKIREAMREGEQLRAHLETTKHEARDEIKSAESAVEKTIAELQAEADRRIKAAATDAAARAARSEQLVLEQHREDWQQSEAAAKEQLLSSQLQLQEAMDSIQRLKIQCREWSEESTVAKACAGRLDLEHRAKRKRIGEIYCHCVTMGVWRPRFLRHNLKSWRRLVLLSRSVQSLHRGHLFSLGKLCFHTWRSRMCLGLEQRARLRQALGRWEFTRKLWAWRRICESVAHQKREILAQNRWEDDMQEMRNAYEAQLAEFRDMIQLETVEKERLQRKAEMSIKVAQVERTARERAEDEKNAAIERENVECSAIEAHFAKAHCDMEEELKAAKESLSSKVQHALEQQRRELEASKRARISADKRVAEAEALAASAREELSIRGKFGDDRLRKELHRNRQAVTKLKEKAATDQHRIDTLQEEKNACLKRLERMVAAQQSPRRRVGISAATDADLSHSQSHAITQNSSNDLSNIPSGAREKLQLQVAQHRAFAIAEKQARGQAEKARDEAVQIAQQATRAIEQMINNAAEPVSMQLPCEEAYESATTNARVFNAPKTEHWYLGDGKVLGETNEATDKVTRSNDKTSESASSGSKLPPRPTRR